MDQWKITTYHGRTIYKNCLFKYMSTMPTGQGFPGSSEGKESGRHGFDSWVRKIPWRRAWRPTPVFLPGESHGQSSLGYKSMGSQRLTEPTNTHTHAYRSENPEDLKEAFLLKCPVPQAYKIPQTYETQERKIYSGSFFKSSKNGFNKPCFLCQDSQVWNLFPNQSHWCPESPPRWSQALAFLMASQKDTQNKFHIVLGSFYSPSWKSGVFWYVFHIICDFWHTHSHCLSKKKQSKYCPYKIYK